MILSHKHKLIFIHIGKTGGTSVETILCQLLNLNWEDTKYNEDVINNLDRLSDVPWWASERDYAGRINCKHIDARSLKQIVGEKIWNDYFKFAFVRNPYDRLLSEYSMFTQFDAFKSHKWNRYGTFNEFLSAVSAGKQTIAGNVYQYYLTDEDGHLLVDYVGKFESLNEDFGKVCDMIGVPNSKLPNKNPTKHRSCKDHYTPETMEMIYNIYKKDFELFQYPQAIDGIQRTSRIKSLRTNLTYHRKYTMQKILYKLKGAARTLISN